MRQSRCPAFGAALILLLVGGCAHTLPATHGCPDPEPDREKVAVRYLGSGGIYLRWRDDALLLGPSFSNPNPFRAYFLSVKPNKERIRNALKHVEMQRVRAIFAGHSHYDHIADIPAIAEAIKVPVHVNAMGKRMLAGEGLDLHELVAGTDPVKIGTSFAVRAVKSGHAPQICKWRRFPLCVYADGPEYESDWDTKLTKRRLRNMRGGETLALVIEVLDRGTPRFRIYYNDSSPDTPLGQTSGDFDLAILTIAQWQWARDYPRDLLSVLRPRHVVISHWDNFFAETTEKSKGVPLLTTESLERFTEIVETYVPTADAGPAGCEKTKWTLPAPMSTMLFTPPR